MRKHLLLILIGIYFTLPSSSLKSQTNYLDLKNIEIKNNTVNKLIFIGRKSKMNDEANLSAPKWVSSNLLTTLGDTFSVQARYHIQSDEIQILFQNQSMTLYPQKVQAITIGPKVFVSSEYEIKDQKRVSYFEILSEGNINLLFRQQTSEPSAKKHHCFYTKKEEDIARPLKVKQKEILEILKKHKTSVSDFIQSNGLHLKKKNDLIQIFNYYNQLVAKE